MDSELIKRQIKIRCPQHQTVFEVTEKPEIICEIREHALSQDFPRGEFWEYCCDCQVFSPSQFGTGGKASENCINCERKIIQRYVCQECKIVACDSEEDTKGKIFKIDLTKGIAPNCPGCQKSFPAKINQHDCKDIEAVLLTSRAECPFCQKSTFLTGNNRMPSQVEPLSTGASTQNLGNKLDSTACPNCGNWGRADRTLCGKCGLQINELPATVSQGSSDPKTLLLGSICPNCGTPNPKDTVFCNSCGQMFKTVNQVGNQTMNLPPPITLSQTGNLPPFVAAHNQTKPPPPPIPVSNNTPPSTIAFNQNSQISTAEKPRPNTPLLIGGVIVAAIFLLIVIMASNKSSSVSNNSSSTTSKTATPSPKKSSSSPASSSTSNPYASLVGKTGHTTKDVIIRSDASPNYPRVGLMYANSKFEILEAKIGETGRLWYRIRVTDYNSGCSYVNNSLCGKENEYEDDEGWIYYENVELNS